MHVARPRLLKSSVHTLGPIFLATLGFATGCDTAQKADVSEVGLEDNTPGTVDDDGDGFTGDEDCSDGDASVNPGAVELCNGIDDNCDGVVDEGVTNAYWIDADGDGYGDPGTLVEACAAPEGSVPNDTDCDDDNADIHPGATETCNELDDDCDGTIDDDLASTWYADADDDGYGDASRPVEACNAPTGYIADNTDCDDVRGDVYPGALEVCDERDNDCDALVDEEVATTYYIDLDADGWGGFSGTTEACSVPVGYAEQLGDCDDGEASVNPDAPEVCNEIDDDCDGDIDDADASVDVTTGGTFYTDADADGFGDASTGTWSCSATSTTVMDSSDCDDGNALVNPAAAEVCNEIDDDCDGAIDDNDASVDLSTGTTYYTDSDSDGYGDTATSRWACEGATDEVTVGTDCDDTSAAVHPAATEVCNEVDDDCDGDIDDDDSSLDTSTATTWYADADSDGEGDPDVSVLTCEAPSGYVDNDTDCDDTDDSDLDGDTIQDCADDDRDGDDLRNDWDADPDDDTVVRGPTGGLGTDGPWTVSGTETMSDWTLLAAAASSGDTTLSVDDGSLFASGDEVLVLSQQGTDAGTHQFVFVASVSSNTLSIEPPLEDSYGGSSVVLVQRVPHHTTVTVPASATIAANDWGGSGGGVIAFRATDAVTIAGTVSADGTGFEGGDGVYGNSGQCYQGESYGGSGASGTTSANGGGGGCYPQRGDNGDSGAGGGYGSSGSAGTNYSGSSVTSGGSTYGSTALSDWFLGSGGGGGSPDSEGDGVPTSNYAGDGGDGGGLIALFSATSITVSGALTCDGEDGDDAHSYEGEVGGGGAGSGGTIWLTAPSLALSGTITASGGSGGASAWHGSGTYGSAYGGDGGDGRVRLEYTSLSGSTSPSAGSTGSYSD